MQLLNLKIPNSKIFSSVADQDSKGVFFDNALNQILNIILMFYILFNTRLKIIHYKES